MTHFVDDKFDGTEVEVAVDIVDSKIVEAEYDMQNVLDMVLHESPRDCILQIRQMHTAMTSASISRKPQQQPQQQRKRQR